MEKYKLKLIKKDEIIVIGTFKTKNEAIKEMNSFIASNNLYLGNDEKDEDYISSFDFVLEEVKDGEIKDFYDACEFLNIRENDVSETYVKMCTALHKLLIIAKAWNQQDDFIPDFNNREQCKWYPQFEYSDNDCKFIYIATTYTSAFATVPGSTRLCFKSAERAEQFGKQFIDLWNNILLNKIT